MRVEKYKSTHKKLFFRHAQILSNQPLYSICSLKDNNIYKQGFFYQKMALFRKKLFRRSSKKRFNRTLRKQGNRRESSEDNPMPNLKSNIPTIWTPLSEEEKRRIKPGYSSTTFQRRAPYNQRSPFSQPPVIEEETAQFENYFGVRVLVGPEEQGGLPNYVAPDVAAELKGVSSIAKQDRVSWPIYSSRLESYVQIKPDGSITLPLLYPDQNHPRVHHGPTNNWNSIVRDE